MQLNLSMCKLWSGKHNKTQQIETISQSSINSFNLKIMKYTLDVKSTVIGFLGAALLISTIGFKNTSEEKDGKFKAVIGEKGIVMLDTQTGAYIIAPYISEVGKVTWIKGDFYETHKVSIDNKKIPKP